MKNATFRQLRVFNEVAKQLSFVKAAVSLHLTPPAVTMQVKELEAHVGMPLFDRQGKKISLTTGGEYMLVYVRKILSTIQDAEDASARLRRTKGGELKIGLVGTAQYFMMQIVAQFLAENEGVRLKLQVANREQLLRMLEDNEIDLAVMGQPPSDLPIRGEPFAANPLVFIVSPQHPLLQVEHMVCEDLLAYPVIVREPGSGTRIALEKFFSDRHQQARFGLELRSNEAVKQAVMANLGIGFLSLHTVGIECQQKLLRVLDVQGTPLNRAWYISHTRSKHLSPPAEAFRYFVLEQAEMHLAKQFHAFQN